LVDPQPDLTIKAISFQSGRKTSPSTIARFHYIVADPVISGTNALSFYVLEPTVNAAMWYTIDGSDPINGPPSIGPVFNNNQFSFTNLNFTFKIRAFRTNYQTSDIETRTFSRGP
jgi:hypothetical protein